MNKINEYVNYADYQALRHSDKKEFPSLTSDQYVSLHKRGEYEKIVDHSYRLITAQLERYQLRPYQDIYSDALHACILMLYEAAKEWNPKKCAWSTYTFYRIKRVIEDEVKLKEGALSYGCYESYVIHNKGKISTQTIVKCEGEDIELEDVIESTSLDPSEELERKDDMALLKKIRDVLTNTEVKASEILYDDNIDDSQIPWLWKNYYPIYRKELKIKHLIPLPSLLSSTCCKSHFTSNLRTHLSTQIRKKMLASGLV